MRFSVAAILGLAAFAAAQNTTNPIGSSITSAVSSASSVSSASRSTATSLSPEAICLSSCGAADICCQAKCVNVPCPNTSQINATTECAGRCPQGNGSKADTDRYAACQQACISSYFFSSGSPSTATSSSRSGSAGASATGSGSATRSGSGSATATGATATQNAAPEIRFGAAGASLLGLIALGLAL